MNGNRPMKVTGTKDLVYFVYECKGVYMHNVHQMYTLELMFFASFILKFKSTFIQGLL